MITQPLIPSLPRPTARRPALAPKVRTGGFCISLCAVAKAGRWEGGSLLRFYFSWCSKGWQVPCVCTRQGRGKGEGGCKLVLMCCTAAR
jgi:hypothetical protein